MNTRLSLYFGLAAMCAALISPAPGYPDENVVSNARALSMCVSVNQNAIVGDIEPGKLTYVSTAKKSSDDQHQYDLFVGRALDVLKGVDSPSEKELYVTFSVYFHFDKRIYKQIAAAVICRKEFSSKENECRNRTYFSFLYYEPEVLADAILEDILKYEPVIARCGTPKRTSYLGNRGAGAGMMSRSYQLRWPL